jgi:hypothetical protein
LPVKFRLSEEGRNRLVRGLRELSPKCGNNNEPLDKRTAVVILGELLKRE